MTGLVPPTTTTEPNYSHSALARLAGPLAVAAGLLMVVVELAILPIVDVDDHVGTSTNLVYRISGVVYFVAFCLLVLVAVAAYARQAHRAGRLGLIGMIAAVVGTMWLGGDLWFESFYVTYIADHAPQVLELDPGGMIVIGAISSYLLFAIGWALFGIASLRAGVFPRVISAAIIIGGLLGFQALLPPWGIALGLAMVWLGVWLIRTPAQVEAT
ncbi:hypothetical protein ACFWUU_12235 [Kribbella sp. NPDC058693]|uniref:hypothetical protein n=1 Tax=Kribbella sp. NPDC058693 TaxID=3346602 RepID=UPI0036565405